MALKHHEFFRNDYTIHVASHALSALVHEALLDLGYDCLVTRAVLDERSAVIGYRCERRYPTSEDIEELERFLLRHTGLHVELREATHSEEHLDNHEHLRRARAAFRNLIRQRLLPLLSSPYEHLMLLWWSGDAVLLPGGETRVVFPERHYTATAHTHPSGFCIPSSHDLDSFARLLADGGCCAAIVSPSCILLVGRRDALSIEDYDALLLLSRRMDKLDLNEALRALSELSTRTKTLIIELRAP